MINQSTIAALRAMKLTAMADELEAQFADQTTYVFCKYFLQKVAS